MSINKADVYRKAAEVIVRDGKNNSGLVQGYYALDRNESDLLPKLLTGNAPVCALGACARAHYELTGEVLVDHYIYKAYSFDVEWTFAAGTTPWGDPGKPVTRKVEIYTVNDHGRASAEDIALILKKQAEEVDHA